MDISVIIPCHNLENYIERCIRSITGQNYGRDCYEIILVLDSCTDKTEDAIRQALKEFCGNYRVLKTAVRNAGLARNIGLDAASGEYVLFVDGDDYLIDNEAFTKLISKNRYSGTQVTYMTTFECETKPLFDPEAIWRYLIRRSFIGDTRFPNLEINEDWAFIKELKKKENYSESQIDDCLYHYTYPREGSVVTTYVRDRLKKI